MNNKDSNKETDKENNDSVKVPPVNLVFDNGSIKTNAKNIWEVANEIAKRLVFWESRN